MPEPRTDESQEQFVSRCISYIIGTEHMFPNTAEGRKKAAGRCHGIWRSKHKAIEETLKDIKEQIIAIKSIIINKVTTPPLKNIHEIEPPKVEENKKKTKPCVE